MTDELPSLVKSLPDVGAECLYGVQHKILGWGGHRMYSVAFVEDQDLPADQAWLLACDQDGNCYCFIKRSRLCPRVLEEAWAGYRQIAHRLQLVA